MVMGMIKQLMAGWVLLLAFFILPVSVMADVCATVKIEIRQELTLERQAFDAHMRINNALTHITLENINIEVLFTDENGDAVLATSDPNNTDALFFIRTDSMENIDDVSGSGQVAPASSADIHWLIIPSPGSASEDPQGTLYYVGARLTYDVGGEESVTEVTPDYIFVKPLPELTLDYFLPRDVYADDPFTPEIESPEPFSLGARVQNNGHGVARNLRIESAQPEIVENELGLLIDFVIQGSQIGLEPAENTLLIYFGDIEPNTSKMAKWLMTTSLSGRFVEFDAEFTHSDELGGTLTSLIEAVNTHTLVREVLVDVAGRDLVYDFLALDGDVYRVYESNGPDTAVVDHSGASTLQFTSQNGGERHYTLTTPVTAGFMVVRLEDPENGQRLLTSAVRSDGKQIKPENIWLAKTQNEDHSWSHWLYLFDANTPGTYTLTYEDVDAVPQPPVLQFIPDRTVAEGNQVSFIVEASDPNGMIPSLTAAQLPAGAGFSDSGTGTAIFDWTPQIGQAGQYPITFTASDGQLTATRQATIAVCSVSDTDCDNLSDDWEITHFGNLDHDGSGDTDGDGLTDLEEYFYGTDPNAIYHGPSVPGILSPVDGSAMDTLQPTLSVANSTGSSSEILYTFELYADAARTQLVVTEEDVSPGVNNTQWAIPVELQDNTHYYWRVRASDGLFRSLWADGSFVVNTANDPPALFSISYPADTAHVDTVTPTLAVVNAIDPDNDFVFYTFTVFADIGMTDVIATSPTIVQGDEGVTTWALDTILTDGEIYT